MLLEEFDAEKYERTIREEGREDGIQVGMMTGQCQATIELLQEMNRPKEFVKKKLLEKYAISEGMADEMLQQFWKE